jgi:hypothetical protein
MLSTESRSLVLNAWRTFAERDEASIAGQFTEDFEWVGPMGNATSRALDIPLPMKGPATVAHFLAIRMRQLYRSMRVDITGVFADGDTVVVEETTEARLPNGAAYKLDYCLIFKCRDGKICQVREYMDTLGQERQVYASDPWAVEGQAEAPSSAPAEPA